MQKLIAIALLLPTLLWSHGTTEAAERPFSVRKALSAIQVAKHSDATLSEVLEAWNDAPYPNQVAVVAAVEQLDANYVYASSNPDVGFDCSGLMKYAWGEAGVDLPSNSRKQINVTFDGPLHAGDLMWYSGHIMMWLGVDDYVIHAASRRLDVTISRSTKATRMGRVLPTMPPGGLARAF